MHASPGPEQQFVSKNLTQASERVTHPGLGHAESVCCARNIAFAQQSIEDAQQVKVQIFEFHRLAPTILPNLISVQDKCACSVPGRH
jgi:hypothetical protein